jgi:hypothetical protein
MFDLQSLGDCDNGSRDFLPSRFHPTTIKVKSRRQKRSICVLSDKSHLTFDKIPMEFIDQHKINSLSSFRRRLAAKKENFPLPYPHPPTFCSGLFFKERK